MIKNRTPFILGFWILVSIQAGGCKERSTTLAQMPDICIPEDEMNTQIRLEAPAGWNTFKIGEVIG